MFQQLLETICYRYIEIHAPARSNSVTDVEAWFQNRDSHMFSYLSWGHVSAFSWRDVAIAISQSTIGVREIADSGTGFKTGDVLHGLLHKMITLASYPMLKSILRGEYSRAYPDIELDPSQFLWTGLTGPTFIVPKNGPVVVHDGRTAIMRNGRFVIYGHAQDLALGDGIYEVAFPVERAVIKAAFFAGLNNDQYALDFSVTWELWLALSNRYLILSEYTPGIHEDFDKVIRLLQQAKTGKFALPVSALDLRELMEAHSDRSQV